MLCRCGAERRDVQWVCSGHASARCKGLGRWFFSSPGPFAYCDQVTEASRGCRVVSMVASSSSVAPLA